MMLRGILLAAALISADGMLQRTAASSPAELQLVSASACMPNDRDFSYMWWAHGLRGRDDQGRMLRCVRTGHYGLVIDAMTADLVRLGRIERPCGYADALTEPNRVVLSLPPSHLRLSVTVQGKTYTCVRTGVVRNGHSDARLIESGRFVQRSDFLGLEFQDASGVRLEKATGRLELFAWPDRFELLLDVQVPSESTDSEDVAAEARFAARIDLTAGERTFFSTGESHRIHGIAQATVRLAIDMSTMSTAAPSPVRATATDLVGGEPAPVSFYPLPGHILVELNDNRREGQHNDATERVRIRLENPDNVEQVVRLRLAKERRGLAVPGIQSITGVSPMLCDIDGLPTGLPIQISKNWHLRPDRPVLYEGPWVFMSSLLRLPPNSAIDLQAKVIYAHYGGVPAASHAQLCLIGWGSNQLWEQAAIGAWGESICFEPDQGQRGGTVLDTRPLMVWSMNSDEPRKWGWTNNVGGADFLVYYGANGKKQHPVRMRAMYGRSGPCRTETTYAGMTEDQRIAVRATAGLWRTDDITRGIYHFRYDVLAPVEFSRLVLFQCGGDDYSYTGERLFAVGNENGLLREWETQWGGGVYRTEPLPLAGQAPWLSMHHAVSRDQSKWGAWANRGIIVRQWQARLGGKDAQPYVAERSARVRGRDTSLFDFTPPPGVKKLQPGDFVEATVVHVVIPQRAEDYYGPNENLRHALQTDADTWRMIHREVTENHLEVTTLSGRLASTYPLVVEVAQGDSAELSVTGGLGYVPITLTGLSRPAVGRLAYREERAGEEPGEWVEASHWQADFDPESRTWQRTYTLPLDRAGGVQTSSSIKFAP